MSKSQKTKNEQQKDLCITSEQLTEQYKHGNLPDDRLYYYRFKGEPEVQITTQYGLYCEEADNKKEIEVLAPVPSYEEWKKLDKSDKSNAQSSIRFSLEAAIYRELLKECRNILKEQNFYRNTPVETDTTYRTRCLRKQELLTKIDEALR